MTNRYAQPPDGGATVAWTTTTWNTAADGSGDPGDPVAGDTCYPNGNAVDLNDGTITGLTLAGGSSGTDRWGLPSGVDDFPGTITLDGYCEAGSLTFPISGNFTISASGNLVNVGGAILRVSGSLIISGQCGADIQLAAGGQVQVSGRTIVGAPLDGYVATASVVAAAYVLIGHDTYPGGPEGAYDPSYSQWLGSSGQLETDRQEVAAVADQITTVVQDLLGTVDGTLNMGLYALKSAIVDAAYVVTGHDNYTGGSAGTYPTTATSQAAQLATDQGTVLASAEWILTGHSILGQAGSYVGGDYAQGAADQLVADKAAVLAEAGSIVRTASILTVMGTHPTVADSKAEQLADDQAAVNTAKAGVTSTTTILGVTGTLNMALYVLKTNVVAGSWVVSGHSNYTGGDAGTYPTTATSQASQLATDQAAVLSSAAWIVSGHSILGQAGTFDAGGAYSEGAADQLIADTASVNAAKSGIKTTTTILGVTGTYDAAAATAAAAASQLATDQAAVNSAKANLKSTATVLGVTGTLNMALYVLKTDVVAAGDVRLNTPRWTGATGVDVGTLIVTGGAGGGGTPGIYGATRVL
jgi:hypothetical protein